MKKKTETPKVAKTITSAMATWSFIFAFLALFAAWACWNQLAPAFVRFDPYPFVFFNLFLSFIAAIQGSVIMIYQKYADAERDKQNDRIDRNSAKVAKMEKEHGEKLDAIIDLLSKRGIS